MKSLKYIYILHNIEYNRLEKHGRIGYFDNILLLVPILLVLKPRYFLKTSQTVQLLVCSAGSSSLLLC